MIKSFIAYTAAITLYLYTADQKKWEIIMIDS